jgi:hypothetical protein
MAETTGGGMEHVTGRVASEFYLSMSDGDRAAVALGRKYVRYNPLRESLTIEEQTPGHAQDMFALSLPRAVVDEMLRDKTLVKNLSDSMAVAIQLHPEEISEKVRSLREEAKLPPVAEADVSRGAYVGTVIAVGKTQTKTLGSAGGVVVHHNEDLSEIPQANAKVKITYANGRGEVERVMGMARGPSAVKTAGRDRGDGGIER